MFNHSTYGDHHLFAGQYSGEVERRVQVEHVQASIVEYAAEDTAGPSHSHENAHFSLVIRGGSIEKKRTSYERFAGQVSFYAAGELHQFVAVKRPSKHLNLEISSVFFKQYGLPAPDRHPVLEKEGVSVQVLRILRELEDGDSASVHLLLLNLLQPIPSLLSSHRPPWVDVLRDYLHEHWDERPALDQLGRIAGVHPVHISRAFPAYFSCTLGTYMRQLKVHRAMALLAEPDRSLTDIAHTCGFFDQSHFIRVFREHTGWLPAAIKRL